MKELAAMRRNRSRRIVLASLTALLMAKGSPAQTPPVDLTRATLEELMNLPIVLPVEATS